MNLHPPEIRLEIHKRAAVISVNMLKVAIVFFTSSFMPSLFEVARMIGTRSISG